MGQGETTQGGETPIVPSTDKLEKNWITEEDAISKGLTKMSDGKYMNISTGEVYDIYKPNEDIKSKTGAIGESGLGSGDLFNF